MKFGVNVLNFGPGANPGTLERWVRTAESLGYHFVMISDHVANTPDVAAKFPAPFYDPFIALAWLAGITKNIELGTTVIILPYRHPLQVARMAANIDQLSGGRLIFGVGAGWAQQEFESLGVPFERRGALANEYLDVIKRFWTSDVLSYQGRMVSFTGVQTGPRPMQSPHPPIWVGGVSDGALRRAVRYGDAWHPTRFTIPWLKKHGLANLRRIAELEGRPAPVLCPRVKLRITSSPLPEGNRLAGQGTLEQIRRDLELLLDLGAQYVLFDTYADDPRATLNPEEDWAMIASVAEEIVDLAGQALRATQGCELRL